jgi:hypothetical protein
MNRGAHAPSFIANIPNIGGVLLPKVGLIVRLRTVSMLALLALLALLAMLAMGMWLPPAGFGVKYLMRARAVPTRVRKLPTEQTNHARRLAV